MTTRQRRTARLVVLLGGATALIAAGVAARWWVRWPERVAEQLATLVAEGEFAKANLLLAGGAAWTRESNPELITLHDGGGETLALSPDEWKELFTGQKFTTHTRTSLDYLHARQVLETRVPGRRLLTVRKRNTYSAPMRLSLTIERGAVSVSLVDEPFLPTLEGWSL